MQSSGTSLCVTVGFCDLGQCDLHTTLIHSLYTISKLRADCYETAFVVTSIYLNKSKSGYLADNRAVVSSWEILGR